MLEQPAVRVVDQAVVDVDDEVAADVQVVAVRVDVADVRAVDERRMNIIDATSGGRFHHAMTDQRFRAQAFERLLRWQRMRHVLMEPILLLELPELPELPEPTELPWRRGAVTTTEELSAPRRSAAS